MVFGFEEFMVRRSWTGVMDSLHFFLILLGEGVIDVSCERCVIAYLLFKGMSMLTFSTY